MRQLEIGSKTLQHEISYLFSLREANFANMVWFKWPSQYDYWCPVEGP